MNQTQNKKENTVTQDKYLAKVNHYTVDEVQRAMDKVDTDTRALIYSTYKVNEIWYLMNHNSEFCQYIDKLMNHLREYRKIADGLSKMKSCLDKGEMTYTDEEISDAIVNGYKNGTEDMQNVIREKLGLVCQDDVLKQKEESVTMGKILAAYEKMSVEEKLQLEEELQKRSPIDVSWKRLMNTLGKLLSNSALIEASEMNE